MSDAPQVAYSDATPETYRDFTQPHQKQEVYAHYGNAHEIPQKDSTILGLRRRNFWILVVIAIVIIIAAVGGSVGGALAVRNSGSKSEPVGASQSNSPSSAPSTPSSAGPPVASTSATTALYAPLPASSITEIDVSCPSPLVHAFNDDAYDCQPDTNIFGSDITGIYAYSLQQCIDACSTMNLVQGGAKCKSVSLSRDALVDYKTNKGANCWLKNVTSNRGDFKKKTVAVLRV